MATALDKIMTAALGRMQLSMEAKKAGFTEAQAEFYVKNLIEFLEGHIATKQDLKDLELRLRIEIGLMLLGAIGILTIIIKLF